MTAYADTLIAALVARVQGKTALALPAATSALESCAGLVGRGFMAAEVSGRAALVDAITPALMELIGRSLIRIGQVVFLIDTTGGRLSLLPAETHDVARFTELLKAGSTGLPLQGRPGRMTYDNVPASSVLHFMYARDAWTTLARQRPYPGSSTGRKAQCGAC